MTDSKLPAAVKIGSRHFKIEEWNTISSISANRFGECDKTAKVIRVATHYGLQEAGGTLLHEILHAIYDVWKLDDGMTEEHVVAVMAEALCAVWMDNPDVMEFIRLSQGAAGRRR